MDTQDDSSQDCLIADFLNDIDGDQFLSTIDLSDVDDWFRSSHCPVYMPKQSTEGGVNNRNIHSPLVKQEDTQTIQHGVNNGIIHSFLVKQEDTQTIQHGVNNGNIHTPFVKQEATETVQNVHVLTDRLGLSYVSVPQGEPGEIQVLLGEVKCETRPEEITCPPPVEFSRCPLKTELVGSENVDLKPIIDCNSPRQGTDGEEFKQEDCVTTSPYQWDSNQEEEAIVFGSNAPATVLLVCGSSSREVKSDSLGAKCPDSRPQNVIDDVVRRDDGVRKSDDDVVRCDDGVSKSDDDVRSDDGVSKSDDDVASQSDNDELIKSDDEAITIRSDDEVTLLGDDEILLCGDDDNSHRHVGDIKIGPVTDTIPWLSPGRTHLNLMSDSSDDEGESTFRDQVTKGKGDNPSPTQGGAITSLSTNRQEDIKPRLTDHVKNITSQSLNQLEDNFKSLSNQTEERVCPSFSTKHVEKPPVEVIVSRQIKEESKKNESWLSHIESEQLNPVNIITSHIKTEPATDIDDNNRLYVDRRQKNCQESESGPVTCGDSHVVSEEAGSRSGFGHSDSSTDKVKSACKQAKPQTESGGENTVTVESPGEVSDVSSQGDSDDEPVTSTRKRTKRVIDSDESDDDKAANHDSDVCPHNDCAEEPVTSARKKPRRLLDSDESDGDGNVNHQGKSSHVDSQGDDEQVTSARKRSQCVIDSDESDDSASPRKKGHVMRRLIGEEQDMEGEEVDRSAILSPWEEKYGRKETKRRFLREREKKLKEVKKNWKKRRSMEDKDEDLSSYRRIRTVEDSDSSPDSDCSALSDSGYSQTNVLQPLLEEDDSSMEDFIDSQESVTSGPSLTAHLPQMMGKRMAFREAFDHYLSTLVNGALDPDFLKPEYLKDTDGYESVVKPAIWKVEDAINARLRLVFSTAWTPRFRKTLLSRPILCMKEASNPDYDDCEGCGRRGHPYRNKCTLTGLGYDRETLAELPRAAAESWSEEEEGERRHRSAADHNIHKVYKLGYFCAIRSRCYHRLYHHRYNLLQNCRLKVAGVRENRLYRNEQGIFDQCMKDETWKMQMFDDLNYQLESADHYTQDLKQAV